MGALAVADWVRRFMDDNGYLALGTLVVAENLFPPIPSEVVLPLAGFYVGTGVMSFTLALLVATTGSVVGALLLYALGRWGGRPLLLRWGRVVRLDHDRLDRADDWFDEHGWKVVLFGRLLPGVRSLVSIPAGSSEMPIARFAALTATGSMLWNAALIGAGWALGSNWEHVETVVGPLGIAVLGLVLLGLAAALLLHRQRSA